MPPWQTSPSKGCFSCHLWIHRASNQNAFCFGRLESTRKHTHRRALIQEVDRTEKICRGTLAFQFLTMSLPLIVCHADFKYPNAYGKKPANNRTCQSSSMRTQTQLAAASDLSPNDRMASHCWPTCLHFTGGAHLFLRDGFKRAHQASWHKTASYPHAKPAGRC